LLALLLFSCTNDELENNSTNPVINQLKNNLKLDEFTNRNIAKNIVVNWETFFKIEKEGFEIYEIGITETDEVKITSKLFQESLQYELIAIKKNAVTYSYLIQAFSSIQNDLYTGTIQKLYNYTGTLNVFDLQGKELGQLLIHNGVPTNPSNNSKLAPLALAIKLFSPLDKNGLTNKLLSCDNTYSFSTLFTHHYDDRYEIWSNAVTGEVYTVKFLGREYIRTTTSLMSVSYPCESQYSNDEIHIPYIRKSYKTINYEISDVIEDKIKDTLLDPCPKEVLDKLKGSTNNDIAKMIERFGQPGSIFTINIIPGKVGVPNNFAETSKVNGSELDINIILNKDYIDGTYYSSRPTDLSIATTLTHEIIHAYLISATSEFFAGCGLTICDFPTIYDAYVTFQATKNTSITPDAHEELIATKYVNTIAETVEEFHTGKPVAAGMATQVYTDLAMNGLYRTKYFNKKYPNDPNDSLYKERQRIIKRVHAERSGADFGEITLAGSPCKK
jgi:hypothetical protein